MQVTKATITTIPMFIITIIMMDITITMMDITMEDGLGVTMAATTEVMMEATMEEMEVVIDHYNLYLSKLRYTAI